MLWQVVEFLKDKSVAAVPKYWLKKLKNRTQCYWPKANVETLRRKVTQCAINKNGKNFYPCKVLLKGENFHSFEDALAAEKKLLNPPTRNVSQRQSTTVEIQHKTKAQIKKQTDNPCNDEITDKFVADQKSEETIPQSSQQLNTNDACVTVKTLEATPLSSQQLNTNDACVTELRRAPYDPVWSEYGRIKMFNRQLRIHAVLSSSFVILLLAGKLFNQFALSV